LRGYRVDNKELKKSLVDNEIKTIQELSEISKVNRNTCSQVLEGRIYPSSDVMTKLATALNLDSGTAGRIFFAQKLTRCESVGEKRHIKQPLRKEDKRC